jgi:hypothetical protein
MTQNTKQTFRQYCESTLTKQEFNNLYNLANELPNIKKYNITRALNVPSRTPFELLKSIAPIVHKSLFDLVIDYECSIDVMTAREFLSFWSGELKRMESKFVEPSTGTN